MALLVSTLQNIIKHAVGGTLDSRLSDIDIINDAGRHFINLHEWSWLIRPPVNLSLTASTAYISLTTAAPSFREMISIAANSANYTIRMVTMQEILDRRESPTDYTGTDYWGALVREGQTGVTLAPPVPRIEIWPTPSASVSNAFAMVYRATWTVVDDATDAVNIPGHTEDVFKMYVRAYAEGYEDQDSIGFLNKLSAIDTSPAVQALKDRAGVVQHEYGPLRNGWMEQNVGVGIGMNAVSDL